jgi:hypothetical protein
LQANNMFTASVFAAALLSTGVVAWIAQPVIKLVRGG